MSHSSVCDFCSSEKIRWAYPADDFEIGAIVALDPETNEPVDVQPMGSAGPWAACEECAKLIEANDYEALKERGIKVGIDAAPPGLIVDHKLARTMLANMHAGFRAHRTGPRMEIA